MKKVLISLFFLLSSIFAFENLTSKNFDEKVKGKNVIVDFYKTYWEACEVLGENLHIFDTRSSEDITIYKVDLDEEPLLDERFHIVAYPILIYLKDGKEVGRELGIQNPNDIKQAIKKFFEK